MSFLSRSTTTCTTTDIDLGAYLMLNGAKLHGVEKLHPHCSAFTFHHKQLYTLIHDYEQNRPIRFSPRILFKFRYDLKRAIPPTSV